MSGLSKAEQDALQRGLDRIERWANALEERLRKLMPEPAPSFEPVPWDEMLRWWTSEPAPRDLEPAADDGPEEQRSTFREGVAAHIGDVYSRVNSLVDRVGALESDVAGLQADDGPERPYKRYVYPAPDERTVYPVDLIARKELCGLRTRLERLEAWRKEQQP